MFRLATFVAGVGLATALCGSARAADWDLKDPTLQSCLTGADSNDLTMKDCYYAFAQREDARLNANWKRLITAVGNKSDQASALLVEQRAWIAYRDAACHHYTFNAGTLDQLLGATCYAQIVSQRADELADLVNYYSPD